MFVNFFYLLREHGIPVSPTSFLRLQKALNKKLIGSLEDFYYASRTILVKNERYFDQFDQVFSHYFKDAELPPLEGMQIDELARNLLEEWLRDPRILTDFLGIDQAEVSRLSPQELLEYFKARLEDQEGQHHGGRKWIGTGGTSPVGHSGFYPGGMRVGGIGRQRSALKVANDHRYRDYSQRGPLTQAMVGEALKRLRHMTSVGPRDQINIDKTIRQTIHNGGEISIVFDRDVRDRLKVILAIDNGGWSMEPYVEVVQSLFDNARTQFKDIKTYFFHNTIYTALWRDPARYKLSKRIETFANCDPKTRLVLVGDASMAPYELMVADGSIHIEKRSQKPSIDCLYYLAKTFQHAVWLNPVPRSMWSYTPTIGQIGDIFPMFELTLDGLDRAVQCLMAKIPTAVR